MTIGISYTGSAEKQNNYLRWLQTGGVELLTLSAEENENNGNIENCDGLILSGGIDTHPQYYNSNNLEYDNRPIAFDAKRDFFEIKLFHLALQKSIPILGICRGMQLINCILGGNMQQDLAEKNPVHKAVITDDRKQIDKTHELRIIEGTLLHHITGQEKAIANSAHHQCVQSIADTLMVNCVSGDGVIEGLEWAEKAGLPFLLCVQWHPERMFEFDLADTPLSAGIKNTFINAVQSAK